MVLLVASFVVFIFATNSEYADFDGVSIYQYDPILPDKSLFMKLVDKSTADEAFAAEASMINYCIFPKVYNELSSKTVEQITSTLIAKGLTAAQATTAQGYWVSTDLAAMRRTNTEYNLPYDDVNAANPSNIGSQYYPPVCRCINKMLNIFAAKSKSPERTEFDEVDKQIKNCIASQHMVKRQNLLGETDKKNTEIKKRKYISRHAMFFQLCLAFLIDYFYNMIDFNAPSNRMNIAYYAGVLLIMFVIWLSNQYAYMGVNLGITFGSIIMAPAIIMFIIIETVWVMYSRYLIQVKRKSFMNPTSFYIVMASLYTIAMIENGVFTISVIVTHILQSYVIAMAYAAVLFASHGSIWKGNSSGKMGLFLMIAISGINQAFIIVPRYPVNNELNFLWVLPLIFSIMAYGKVLFVEHIIGDENDPKESRENYRMSLSSYMFNIGHVILNVLILVYFIINIAYMASGDAGKPFLGTAAGRLTKKLNFALAEMNVLTNNETPFYNALSAKNTDYTSKYFMNP